MPTITERYLRTPEGQAEYILHMPFPAVIVTSYVVRYKPFQVNIPFLFTPRDGSLSQGDINPDKRLYLYTGDWEFDSKNFSEEGVSKQIPSNILATLTQAITSASFRVSGNSLIYLRIKQHESRPYYPITMNFDAGDVT